MGPKKKSKGGKGDKEKPLLTVQGVLRLERSFVTAQHADAEVIMVKKDENEEAEPMRLVPGGGEHEHVSYKTGYDMGPANPLPTNEPESEMYEAMKKVDEKEEQFEALKKQSGIERKEREAKFRRENLIPEDELKPPGDDEDENGGEGTSKPKPKIPKIDPQELDPNDPSNYILPPEMANQDDDEPETENAMETDQEDQSGLSEEQKNMIPTEMKPLPVVEPTRIEKERTKILEKLDKEQKEEEMAAEKAQQEPETASEKVQAETEVVQE